MKIVISTDLDLRVTAEAEYRDRESRFSVIGELLGAYDGQGSLERDEVIELFKDNLSDLRVLLRYVRCSVGKYYLVLQNRNEIIIICSASSPGIFYTFCETDLIISNNETEAYSYSSLSDLDDMEVLNVLVSHPAYRSPFSTIFKNVKRIPGGMLLRIKSNHVVETELFIHDDEEPTSLRRETDEQKYQEFVRYLEETIKLIVNDRGGEEKYVLLSGGIDSSVLLIAALKHNRDIQVVHFPEKEHEGFVVKALADKLGLRIGYLDLGWPYSESEIDSSVLDRIKTIYQTSLCTTTFVPIFMVLQSYLAAKESKLPCIMSGQNMEEPYMIQCVLHRGVSNQAASIYHSIRQGLFVKQLLFSKIGHKLLANARFRFLKLHRSERDACLNLGYNVYDYMLFLTLPTKGYSVPFDKIHFLPPQLANMTKDFCSFKKDTFLDYAIEHLKPFRKLIGAENPTDIEINKLAKIILFLKYNQNACLNYWQYSQLSGYDLALPATEGPLLSFFLAYQLSFKDAFVAKRYLYRYFRDETGIDFRTFIRDAKPRKIRIKSLVGQSFLWRIVGPIYRRLLGRTKTLPESGSVANVFGQLINMDDSILVPNVKNDAIRQYIIDLYGKLGGGNGQGFSKNEIFELEMLVNLEVCLKHIFREKDKGNKVEVR